MGRLRSPARRAPRARAREDARGLRRRAPALHPLHLGLDREAEGRPAHDRRLPAGAHVTTQVRLRPARRRRLLVHRRRRLGHRPQLHRLRPALERRDRASCTRARPTSPTGAASGSIIERHGVTILYTAPTAIRAFIRGGDEWPKKHDLSSRCASSAASASRSTPRRGCGTTASSAASAARSSTPGGRPRPARIMMTTLPGAVVAKPGSDGAAVLRRRHRGREGRRRRRAAPNEGGKLVIKQAVAVDAAHALGRRRALPARRTGDVIPGVYFTGDGARRDEDGYFWVVGRIDDVLNVAGPPHRHRRDRERARVPPRGRRGRRGRAARRPEGPGARRLRHAQGRAEGGHAS